MVFGIATTSIIPMRAEAFHQSEMVSQILFGELFTIIGCVEDWSKIKLDFDGTEGWINNSMFQDISADLYNELKHAKSIILDNISDIVIGNSSHSMRVMPGSEIHINGLQSNQMIIGNKTFSLKHRTSIPMRGNTRHSVLSKALEYMNAPYLWGGRSPFGIDCSGFTQIVYKLHGIVLPREVEDQFSVGRIVKDFNEAMPGDLAFMANENGQICHVGIIIEPNKIIHADGFIRLAMIENKNICNIDSATNKYSLSYIRNVID